MANIGKVQTAATEVVNAKFSYDEITDFARFLNQNFTGYKYMNDSDKNRIIDAIYKEKNQIVEVGKQLDSTIKDLIAAEEYLRGSVNKLKDVKITGTSYHKNVNKKLKEVETLRKNIETVVKSINTCIDT